MNNGPDRRWRVLLVHNRYQRRGGEDAVVDAEAALLQQHGHAVARYERHNDDADTLSAAHLARDTLWSTRTARELRALAQRFRPDVVHVHNSFALISPSAHATAHALGLPVLQTLHNFRLLCPQATLLRDGRPCTVCVGRVPWRAVWHRCYRASAPHSAALATLLQLHRLRGTWQRDVTLFIALNRWCADTFVRGGLDAQRLRIKPHFVDLPAPPDGPRQGLLWVGRLSAEKGTALLARAAALRPGAAPVRVLGDGPERQRLQGLPGLQLLGEASPDAVRREMQRASALLLPSLAAESFPRTLVEAFACALPVIASRAGALPELVADGRTGWLFDADAPDAAEQLAACLQRADAQPDTLRALGRAARQHQQRHWSGEANHRQLCALYAEAQALHAAA